MILHRLKSHSSTRLHSVNSQRRIHLLIGKLTLFFFAICVLLLVNLKSSSWKLEFRYAYSQPKRHATEFGFNIELSNALPLNRSIPDIRPSKCRNFSKHGENYPPISIIIPFYNEHLKTLLRTITAVLSRSPVSTWKELILVNDGSPFNWPRIELKKYLSASIFNVSVHTVEMPNHQGLIRAKIHGARIAKGDILIFLDSHCEPNEHWIPPLLEPILLNYKTVTCPTIDIIDSKSFRYYAQDEGRRGIFDWNFLYKRTILPEDLHEHPEMPFTTPVMAGGLFAVSRRWFWELGGYDPGMLFYGSEQFELSFKIWMCGGTLLDIPCSRVGHIYREHPISYGLKNPRYHLLRNYRRVADVWMDEYRQYLFLRNPHLKSIDPGNLSSQIQLRNRLNCKTFKWFLENIASDLLEKYPPMEPEPIAEGDIRPSINNSWCVDAYAASRKNSLQLVECSSRRARYQLFVHTFRGELRLRKQEKCVDVLWHNELSFPTLFRCLDELGLQQWHLKAVLGHKNSVWIQHNATGLCIAAREANWEIYLEECDKDAPNQLWVWTFLRLH